MKPVAIILLFGATLFGATWCSAQTGAIGGSGVPVGAYKPGEDPGLNDPADRPPLTVLNKDAKLVAKLQKLLPPALTPQQACDGFKKLSDCVSSIHVAQNLEIPLTDLKTKVIADKSHDALEKAIHELKPSVDAKAERKRAQKQAERDIPASE